MPEGDLNESECLPEDYNEDGEIKYNPDNEEGDEE